MKLPKNNLNKLNSRVPNYFSKPKIPSNKNLTLIKLRNQLFNELSGKYIVLFETFYFGKLNTIRIIQTASSKHEEVLELEFKDNNHYEHLISRADTPILKSATDPNKFLIIAENTGEIIGFFDTFNDRETALLYSKINKFED